MKTLKYFASIFMAVAMITPSFAAAETPVVGGYLPEKGLVKGALVKVELDQELPSFLKKFQESSNKLSQEEQQSLAKLVKPGYPLPYDERFGLSKEEYAKYLESWNKKKVTDVSPVVLGLEATSRKDIWKMVSSTQTSPLPLSTLEYDSAKNIWISPNGELTFKGDVTHTAESQLGAWKGQEWLLEKKDSLSQFAENLIIGKTDDGQYVYVIYNILELTNEGRPTWNENLVIRIPVSSSKKDPLLEKAKKSAGK